MKSLPIGIWSGLIATAQMTQFLFWGFRGLAPSERDPLPPAALTREVGRKTGLPPAQPDRSENHSLLAHFCFGLSCASLYALFQRNRRRQTQPMAEGVAFGMMVWASTYLTGIPALNLRPSVADLSRRQNTLILLSHLVWGASLGLAESALRDKGGPMLDGSRFTPAPETKAVS